MLKRQRPKTPLECRRWEMNYQRHWSECRMPMRHRERLRSGPICWPDPSFAKQAWRTVETGGILAILGSRGTGKTQLAVQLMARCMEELGGSAQYWRADELFERLRPAADMGASDREAFRRTINCTDLLVIDEAQDRVDSQFEDRELRRVVDSRYGAMRATVLICNQTTEKFLEGIGLSIASRVVETGCVLVLPWASFRVPGASP